MSTVHDAASDVACDDTKDGKTFDDSANNLVINKISDDDQLQILMNEKKRLKKLLEEKKEQVGKLKLVKLYRSKNDLADLDSLILKWREASQEAIEELYGTLIVDNRITMDEFLQSMNIDKQMIRYNDETESFFP